MANSGQDALLKPEHSYFDNAQQAEEYSNQLGSNVNEELPSLPPLPSSTNYTQPSLQSNFQQLDSASQSIQSNSVPQRTGVREPDGFSCLYCLFPYFKLKSWAFGIWIAFTLYSFIVSIALSASSNNQYCTYYNLGASYAPAVQHHFQIHRWLLAFFIHQDTLKTPGHWISNSFSYYMVAFQVEHFLGFKRFLLFLLLVQVGAELFSEIIWSDRGVTFGASGAIMGLFGFQTMRIFLRLESIKTGYGCRLIVFPIIAFINVVFVGPQTDRWGHLGGLLAGLLFAPFFFQTAWTTQMSRFKKLIQIMLGLGIGYMVALTITLFFIIDMMDATPCGH